MATTRGIRQRGTGWEVRYRDANGKQRQRTFPTEEAARAWQAQHRADALNNRLTDADKAARPFTYYADLLVEGKKGHVRPRYAEDIRRALDHYAVPFFGGTPVGRITKAQCGDYIRHLSALRSERTGYGLAPATIKKAYQVVEQVLALAASDEALPSNPATLSKAAGAGLRLPRKNTAPKPTVFTAHPLTAEDVNLLCCHLDAADPTGMDSRLVCFLHNTGLRAAELAGLTVADYNPLRHTITVARTRRRVGGTWTEGEPKSERSRRTIPLPSWLVDDLDGYLGRGSGQGLQSPQGLPGATTHPRAHEPTSPLFPGRAPAPKSRGTVRDDAVTAYDWTVPVEPNTFLQRRMRPALLAAGLPAARLHDLRHSYGTNLYLAGVPIDIISRQMGHSTTAVTEAIYVHDDMSGQRYRDAVQVLANPRATTPRPAVASMATA